MKYTQNGIVKQFRVKILQYADCIHNNNNLAKYLPPPSMKEGGMMRQIGPFVTNNDLIIRLALQLGTNFLHPCRMNWMTKLRNIFLCCMNNGVTLCPP